MHGEILGQRRTVLERLKNHMDFQNSYVYLKGAESLGVLTGMLKYV